MISRLGLQVGYVRGSGTITLLLHRMFPAIFPEWHYLRVSLAGPNQHQTVLPCLPCANLQKMSLPLSPSARDVSSADLGTERTT